MLVALTLRCRCNHLRAVASDLSPSTGFRFVCYCGDCQAFARFLGASGPPSESHADATGRPFRPKLGHEARTRRHICRYSASIP
jgi:hypothetical protein